MMAGFHLKWGVDGEALVQKLRDAAPARALALAEAVGAFWRQPDLPTAAGLRAAGLITAGADAESGTDMR